MEWRYGADAPVQLRVILKQIHHAGFGDVPDGSIFITKEDYRSENICLDTPAYIDQSRESEQGGWRYYLELSLIKELFDGREEITQDLLDRVTHYAIYDALPDECRGEGDGRI